MRISFDLDPQVDLVLADKVQVQQVPVNLIRDAIEAMEDSTSPRGRQVMAKSGFRWMPPAPAFSKKWLKSCSSHSPR